MTVPDLVHRNPVRLSSVSCITEDSIDSVTIATPLDASPPPPPSNTFSIINIVNDDPFPNPKAYPAIAATCTRRRRAQTSPRPVPSSIMISNNIPQEQPVMIYDTTSDSQVPNSTMASSKSSKFWPRIKRMMMPSNNDNSSTDKMKQLFESMNISNKDEKTETKLQELKSNKRWLGKNRARVGPQR